MLKAALAFLVLSIFAYVLGASGTGGLSLEWGRLLLIGFLVLATIGVSAEIINGDRPDNVL